MPETSIDHQFRDLLCSALAAVFEQTAGVLLALEPMEGGDEASQEPSLLYRMEFAGTVCGIARFEFGHKAAAYLANGLLGGDEEPAEFEPDHEDAVVEILNQAAGLLSTQFRDRYGEATVRVDRDSKSRPASMIRIGFKVAQGGQRTFSLKLSEELLASFGQAETKETKPESQPNEAAATATQGSAAATHESALRTEEPSPAHDNVSLIADVELELTLRFGQRKLPLSEVIDLTTGAVVELDRKVDEPVELLLGERVIAKGDVVLVNGSYGLRVTELIPADQRLAAH